IVINSSQLDGAAAIGAVLDTRIDDHAAIPLSVIFSRITLSASLHVAAALHTVCHASKSSRPNVASIRTATEEGTGIIPRSYRCNCVLLIPARAANSQIVNPDKRRIIRSVLPFILGFPFRWSRM